MNKKFFFAGCLSLLLLAGFGIALLTLKPALFTKVAVIPKVELIVMYAVCLFIPLLVTVIASVFRKQACKPSLSIDEANVEPIDEGKSAKPAVYIKIGKTVLFLILLLAVIIINFFAVRRIWVFSTVLGEYVAAENEKDCWVQYQRDGLILNIYNKSGYSEGLLIANLDLIDVDDLKSVADKYTIVVSNEKVAQYSWEMTHGLSNVVYYAYVDEDILYCAGSGFIPKGIEWAAK